MCFGYVNILCFNAIIYDAIFCQYDNLTHYIYQGFERQSVSRGGAERETHTESEAGSMLQAVGTEPYPGLELTNCEIMT